MTSTMAAPSETVQSRPAKGTGITLPFLPEERRWRRFFMIGGIFSVLAVGLGSAVWVLADDSGDPSTVAAVSLDQPAGASGDGVTPSATTTPPPTTVGAPGPAVQPGDQPAEAATSSSSSSTSTSSPTSTSSSTSTSTTSTSTTTTTTAPTTTTAAPAPPPELVVNATKSASLASVAGSNCPEFAQNGIPKQGGPFNFTIRRSGDNWTMTISDGRSASTTNTNGVDVAFAFGPRTTEPGPGFVVTTQMTETMTFNGTSINGTNVTRYTFSGTAGPYDFTGVECIATFAVTGTLSQALA